MSEGPAQPASFVILEQQPKRRWHSRRAKGEHSKKLPPLQKEEAEVKVEQKVVQSHSSLVKAGALYGGRVSPPPYGGRASPSRPIRAYVAYERTAMAADVEPTENAQLPQEAQEPSSMVTIREDVREKEAEVAEKRASPLKNLKRQMTQNVKKKAANAAGEEAGDEDEEEEDDDVDDPAPFVVGALLEYAADALSDEFSDGEAASTCSAWSYDDCDYESASGQEQVAEQDVQRQMKQVPSTEQLSPVPPVLGMPLAGYRGTNSTRSLTGRDRASPTGMPTLDDLLKKPRVIPAHGGKRLARSHKPSPRTKLAPVDPTSDRRMPLTAR